jgi:hypothetical protein
VGKRGREIGGRNVGLEEGRTRRAEEGALATSVGVQQVSDKIGTFQIKVSGKFPCQTREPSFQCHIITQEPSIGGR